MTAKAIVLDWNAPERRAVAAWENEGGRVAGASPSSRAHPAGALPPGYCTQPVHGFHDADEKLFYQFYRVYGLVARDGARGEVSRQDEDRCFWAVMTDHGSAPRDLEGRSVTYAQARGKLGRRLSFPRFSSIRHMRSELLRLVAPPAEDSSRAE